ncbi:MAG: HAMP domain-containing sensor histidine kinase [Myxococcota bacterium]
MQGTLKRPPTRLTLALLAWALLSCGAVFFAVQRYDAAQRQTLAEMQTERRVGDLAQKSADALGLGMALDDPELIEDVAKRLLDRNDALAGLSVALDNGRTIVLGETGGRLVERTTRLEHPGVDASMLFSGDKPPATDATTGLGSVTIHARPATVPAPSTQRSVELAAILGVVLASMLGVALWVRSGLRKLVTTAAALASGKLDDIPESLKGGGELGWAARALADLRAVWSAEVDRVQGRNAALLRDVTLKEDRLERIASFAASLVAPISQRDSNAAALRKLAEQTDAHMAILAIRGADGMLEIDSAIGLPVVDGDLRIEAGLARCGLSNVSCPTMLAPMEPDHPWMDAASRHVPLEGVAAVPLQFRGNCEGFVIVATRAAFGDDDLGFLGDAAHPLAIALANRRAYDTVLSMKSELQQRNELLVRQKEKLEEVNRLRGQFVANVSHELRTPLNAIIGYADLLLEGCYGDIDDEQREPLESQLLAATSLLELVNQVLDLSRADADGVEVTEADADLYSVADEVVRMSEPLCRERDYRPTLEGAPLVAHTDASAVRQILRNLVGNAIKFTAEGRVHTRVYVDGEGSPCIDVCDSGLGIDAAHQELIFEEFRQVDGSATREHNGVGLGLAISRKLARALGGDLTVQSTVGHGSTFTLSLPPASRRELSSAA